jgi:cyanate lyase
MITRTEATAQILAAKKAKGLTFEAIAAAVGRHKVWVTTALMGQATMSADEATAAARILGLGPEVAEALQEMPMKARSTVPCLWIRLSTGSTKSRRSMARLLKRSSTRCSGTAS